MTMETTPIYNELLHWPEYQELDDLQPDAPAPLEGTQDLESQDRQPWKYDPASYDAVTIYPVQQQSLMGTMSRNHPLYENSDYSPTGSDEIFYNEEPHQVIYTPSDYDTKALPLVEEPTPSKQAQGSSIMDELESISTRTTGNYLGTKQRRKSKGRNRR